MVDSHVKTTCVDITHFGDRIGVALLYGARVVRPAEVDVTLLKNHGRVFDCWEVSGVRFCLLKGRHVPVGGWGSEVATDASGFCTVIVWGGCLGSFLRVHHLFGVNTILVDTFEDSTPNVHSVFKLVKLLGRNRIGCGIIFIITLPVSL